MGVLSSMFVIPNLLFFFFETTYGVDSITPSQSLTDGNTLVSKEGNFELGFFSPGSSKNRYLGIWHNIQDKTVVWVANRDSPIDNSSGILMINSTGSLVLLSQNKSVVWSTSSLKQAQTPLLQLLDTGNLVLADEKKGKSEDYLWQSFDYPADTLLPGMKLGWDLKRGLNRRFIAWKNWDDPSSGDFILEMTLHNYPEVYLFQGRVKYNRFGPWSGIGFSGTPEVKPNPVFNFTFVYNQDEVYFMFTTKDKSLLAKTVPNQTTSLFQIFIRKETAQSWKLFFAQPADHCDRYGVCGAYGICIVTELPVCQCLKGFKPKSQQKWDSMDWSQGCVRNKPLNCQEIITHRFVKFPNVKVPDTTYTWVNKSMNLKECREKCLSNCSCTAYTNSDIKEGIGCAIWFGDLLDIKKFSNGGQDLYIRMHPSELGMENGHDKNIAAIVACSIVVVSGMLLGSYYVCSKENIRGIMERMRIIVHTNNSRGPEEDMELPLFDLSTIARATDDFSLNNKLGEGGFGPVYKGTLLEGKDIAVKRLSKSSGQGLNEFKNEVNLIAKLQHRNLVKLLGTCIQENEKMLIYEYMPNKSLDSFIFDKTKSNLLDWRKRIDIIGGIARGLLYLHEDSRLRIIHRDLKASNILLDNIMNPKISDFGLAKLFGGDQCEANTNRIVGTYGYMSPEYAVDGQYSIKSDVFSFGVLVLEIISGKKNRGFHHPEQHLNLLGHAWRLWIEDRPIELIDDSVGDFNIFEVLRCIHVGLLCVQNRQEDRPNMSYVVLMLSSESLLPKPRQPAFYTDSPHEADSSLSTTCSENKITFTSFEAR